MGWAAELFELIQYPNLKRQFHSTHLLDLDFAQLILKFESARWKAKSREWL